MSWLCGTSTSTWTSRTLRYVSTTCRARKHVVSVGQSSSKRRLCSAVLKSPSALWIHCRTISLTASGSGIERSAVLQRVSNHGARNIAEALYIAGRHDHDVLGNGNITERLAHLDFTRLSEPVAKRYGRSMFGARMARLDEEIDRARKAVRADPAEFQPRLRLALAFHQKSEAGAPEFQRLMWREFQEALQRVPPNREDHLVLIDAASSLGCREELASYYGEQRLHLPFADECRALALTARTPAASMRLSSRGGKNHWKRLRLLTGVILAVPVVVHTWVVFKNNERRIQWSLKLADDPRSSVPYISGVNLVKNDNALGRSEGWILPLRGNLASVSDGVIHMRRDSRWVVQCSRDLVLPQYRPRWLVIVAIGRVTAIPQDGPSGLPFYTATVIAERETLHVSTSVASVLVPMMRTVCAGVAQLPPGRAMVKIQLQFSPPGWGQMQSVECDYYDSFGVYLFNSAALAHGFAGTYDGAPPSQADIAADMAVGRALANLDLTRIREDLQHRNDPARRA